MPPGTEAAAEAARSVLLLRSVVKPDGKARDERSWAAWAWASAERAWEPGRHDLVHTGQGLLGNVSALAEIPAVWEAKGKVGI